MVTEQDAEKASSKEEAADKHVKRTWQSQDIFCGAREVFILHGQETYRLLQTKNGKLILQK